MKKSGICVVIPAFNEEESIRTVVEGAKCFVPEVVVVNDGSTDRTSEFAAQAGATVISHSRNCGKGEALRTGLGYALSRGYKYVVTMDGDGQHNAQEIPRILEALENSYADAVIGSRMGSSDSMPFVRRLTNCLMSTTLSILAKKRCSDTQSGFRAVNLQLMRKISLHAKRFDWESEFFVKAVRAGARVEETNISSIYKKNGRSRIKVIPDTIRFIILVVCNIISL